MKSHIRDELIDKILDEIRRRWSFF